MLLTPQYTKMLTTRKVQTPRGDKYIETSAFAHRAAALALRDPPRWQGVCNAFPHAGPLRVSKPDDNFYQSSWGQRPTWEKSAALHNLTDHPLTSLISSSSLTTNPTSRASAPKPSNAWISPPASKSSTSAVGLAERPFRLRTSPVQRDSPRESTSALRSSRSLNAAPAGDQDLNSASVKPAPYPTPTHSSTLGAARESSYTCRIVLRPSTK